MLLSSRRVRDDLTKIPIPFLIFVQRFRRIDECEGNIVGKGRRVAPRREEVAIAQHVLSVGQHEFEEQDRAVRMRHTARDTGAFETSHPGRDDEPRNRGAAFPKLLGFVGVGGECKRHFSGNDEIRQQGVTLANRNAVGGDDIAEQF